MRKKIRIKQGFPVLILLYPFHFLRAQNISGSGVVFDPSDETLIDAKNTPLSAISLSEYRARWINLAGA